jgi:radical SAM protein with 4Fe4S-binding SPASM domain
MIAYAKKKGLIDVYFNTNATLLTEEISKKLLDAGLDRISFSVDGLKDIYDRNRPGIDFWQIIRNIDAFCNIQKKGKYNTKIRIQTVNLPNIDLKKYKDFWKSFWWIRSFDEVAAIDYKEMSGRRNNLEGEWVCPQPWQRTSILYDGNILPCNHDDRQCACLGNVEDISIRKAWHGPGMQLIREAQRKNKGHFISACDGCYLRTNEILKKQEN